MTKFVKRFALVLTLLALCVGLMGVAAFAAYDPVTASIPVDITLTGTLPETPDTFKVEMTADEEGNPLPEGAVNGVYVLELVGASSGTLDIQFSKLGIYNYTVKQLDIGNEDCYQDTHVYKVTAYVTNNEDYTGFDLSVVVYRDDETDKRDNILFENRYANPDEVQITATKTLDKKTPKDGAFQFELVDAEGVVIETVSNVGGDVVFTPISYYQVGTYTYTIREVKGTDKNIIYDKTEYTAVVEVVKDENGDYAATLSYVKGEEPADVAAFANKTKPIVPNTGDNANPLLWGGIMVVALCGIVVLLVAMKKKAKA